MNSVLLVGDSVPLAQVFGVSQIDICFINAKKRTVVQECNGNENRKEDSQKDKGVRRPPFAYTGE